MATGQTYVLLDFQRGVASETIINRYYYQQVSGEGDSASQLIGAYLASVLPQILAIQNVQVEHYRIEVFTPDNPSDFAAESLTTGNVGERLGDPLPDFVTWSYTLQRPFRSFRSGRKAYTGVSELDQNGGVPAPGMSVLLDELATSLSESILPPGGGYDFVHALVKNLDQPIPIREVAALTSVSFRRISTQSSRKT